MKSHAIFICLLLWGGQVVAQQQLQLGVFRSFATGDFASTEWGKGSFAKDGWGVSIENKVRFGTMPKPLFVGFHVSYQRNELDHKAMSTALSTAMGQPVEVRPARYTPLILTVGPFYDINLSRRMSLGLKSGVGLMFTNIDTYRINVNNQDGNLAYRSYLDFNNSPGLTFMLGGQLGWSLARNWKIGLFADYSAGRETANNLLRNFEAPSSFPLSFVNTGLQMSVDLRTSGAYPYRSYPGKYKPRGKAKDKCYPII